MNPPLSLFSVPFDGNFSISSSPSAPPEDAPGKKALEKELSECVGRISELQRKLFADDRFALLLVFQAMDAAGKDGTIRAVLSGVNPAGCQVSSFKAPSDEELDHDWLWRTTRRLPERGRIGVFNRSYYEEVLAVRVHPAYLAKQHLPSHQHDGIWDERFQSIREHERHLSANGTVVVKFWLNVSKEEQKKRFLKRLTTPEKYWKFSKSDLTTRSRWDDYMGAYESLLNETSREFAPWYAIPADDKRYMRVAVARTILDTLEALPLRYPEKSTGEIALFEEHIAHLNDEGS
ncbi:MAG: PPK2 family polyphosphate kinase [Granulosicoccus sp.]